MTSDPMEAAAKAACAAYHYAEHDTPDGRDRWRRNQQQYRVETRAAIQAHHDAVLAGTDEGELVTALKSYQQADPDGIMVTVSRQACDEAADTITALVARNKNLEAATIDWLELTQRAEAAEAKLAETEKAGAELQEAIRAAKAVLPRRPPNGNDLQKLCNLAHGLLDVEETRTAQEASDETG